MARGGSRPNAGRKQGSMNRFNLEMVKRAEMGGQMPLDYMLAVMRDESVDTKVRIDAAKASAPYVHQKLATLMVEVTSSCMTHEEWVQTLN